jgi:hypothetical protein
LDLLVLSHQSNRLHRSVQLDLSLLWHRLDLLDQFHLLHLWNQLDRDHPSHR